MSFLSPLNVTHFPISVCSSCSLVTTQGLPPHSHLRLDYVVLMNWFDANINWYDKMVMTNYTYSITILSRLCADFLNMYMLLTSTEKEVTRMNSIKFEAAMADACVW